MVIIEKRLEQRPETGEGMRHCGERFSAVAAASVKVLRIAACLECVRKHEGQGCWVNLGWEEQ